MDRFPCRIGNVYETRYCQLAVGSTAPNRLGIEGGESLSLVLRFPSSRRCLGSRCREFQTGEMGQCENRMKILFHSEAAQGFALAVSDGHSQLNNLLSTITDRFDIKNITLLGRLLLSNTDPRDNHSKIVKLVMSAGQGLRCSCIKFRISIIIQSACFTPKRPAVCHECLQSFGYPISKRMSCYTAEVQAWY